MKLADVGLFSSRPAIMGHLRSNGAHAFADLLARGNTNVSENDVKAILAPIDDSLLPYFETGRSQYFEDLLFAHLSYNDILLTSPCYTSINGIKLGDNLDDLARIIGSLKAVKIEGISVVIISNVLINPIRHFPVEKQLIIRERIDDTAKWYQQRKFQVQRSLKDFNLYSRNEVHSLAIASINLPSVDTDLDWTFLHQIWRMVRGYFNFDSEYKEALLESVPLQISNFAQQAEELLGLKGARDPSYASYGGAYVTFRYMPTALVGARGDFRYSNIELENVVREGYDLVPVANFYNRIPLNSIPKIFDERLEDVLQSDSEYKWLHFVWDGNHRLRAYNSAVHVIPLVTIEPFQAAENDKLKLYLVPPPFASPFESPFDASDMAELRLLMRGVKNVAITQRIQELVNHAKSTQKIRALKRYGAFKSALEYLSQLQ